MDFSSQFREIADVERTFRFVPKKDPRPSQFRLNLFKASELALVLSLQHGTPVDILGEAPEVPGQQKGAVTVWAQVSGPKKSPLHGLGDDAYHEMVQVKRLWMLMGKSANSYAAGFEGTFLKAFEQILISAAFWKTPYEAWEADPAHYRRLGGLKDLWAVVTVPMGSPVRNGFLIHG